MKKTGLPAARVRGSTALGVLIGLALGVVIAVGIAWYINRTQLPFQDKGQRAPERAAAEPAPSPRGEPEPLPGKPGDKPLERPRFDFYKMLPSGEEVAGAKGEKGDKTGKDEKLAALPPPEILFLQVGAFQESEEADNLKAKLALMGVEAGVQTVDIPDKGTVHRVRIGPFRKPEEMARSRALLAENGIQAKVIKGNKDGAPR